MKRLPWSDVDIAKLCELWRAGVSTGTIAKKFARSKRAIVAKVQKLRDEDGIDLPRRGAA